MADRATRKRIRRLFNELNEIKPETPEYKGHLGYIEEAMIREGIDDNSDFWTELHDKTDHHLKEFNVKRGRHHSFEPETPQSQQSTYSKQTEQTVLGIPQCRRRGNVLQRDKIGNIKLRQLKEGVVDQDRMIIIDNSSGYDVLTVPNTFICTVAEFVPNDSGRGEIAFTDLYSPLENHINNILFNSYDSLTEPGYVDMVREILVIGDFPDFPVNLTEDMELISLSTKHDCATGGIFDKNFALLSVTYRVPEISISEGLSLEGYRLDHMFAGIHCQLPDEKYIDLEEKMNPELGFLRAALEKEHPDREQLKQMIKQYLQKGIPESSVNGNRKVLPEGHSFI